jgi:hypothetical protein
MAALPVVQSRPLEPTYLRLDPNSPQAATIRTVIAQLT